MICKKNFFEKKHVISTYNFIHMWIHHSVKVSHKFVSSVVQNIINPVSYCKNGDIDWIFCWKQAYYVQITIIHMFLLSQHAENNRLNININSLLCIYNIIHNRIHHSKNVISSSIIKQSYTDNFLYKMKDIHGTKMKDIHGTKIFFSG